MLCLCRNQIIELIFTLIIYEYDRKIMFNENLNILQLRFSKSLCNENCDVICAFLIKIVSINKSLDF